MLTRYLYSSLIPLHYTHYTTFTLSKATLSRTEILPIRGQIRVGSGVILDSPGWSGMVRDTTTEVLECFKLPGSSVTVRDDSLVRGNPGRSV